MKNIQISFYILLSLLSLACNNHTTPSSVNISPDSTTECAPIKDPNNAKPMALMMRQMASNADSMRAQLLRGETLDSTRYPFIRFYLVEPTDPNVLQPSFYENARLFQEAYSNLFKNPTKQTQYYNLMIQKCVNCHEQYCSGPLKKIKKLPITLK
jgi:hypothetical protein